MTEKSWGVDVTMLQRTGAEFLGTFWLTFAGCGSAVLAAKFPELGIGFTGVSLAFGLTVLTMAFAVGHISGGHFNPAVTFGLWAGGRFKTAQIVPYVIVQLVGAIAAAAVLFFVASKPGVDLAGFASNGYGDLSPGKYPLVNCFVVEALLTFFFLIVILGSTSPRAPAGFAPIAIGFVLTLINLVAIPVTNCSVNPARSLGPALFATGGDYIGQVWLFFVAPILGAIVGGLVSRALQGAEERPADVARAAV